MKIVFVSNFYSHHQDPLCRELEKLTENQFVFIETAPMTEERLKMGWALELPHFVRQAYLSESIECECIRIANEADVVIIGNASEAYVSERLKNNKLTFRYNERWFKSKPWFLSGPRAWYLLYKNHLQYRNKPLYLLAASAFAANDAYSIGAYKNKIFKWGYFTKVETNGCETKVEASIDVSTLEITSLMWCSRFLKWKHPELPILLAERLKKNGVKFCLDMYGTGECEEEAQALVNKHNLNDVVNFRGNMPNDLILQEMKRHKIFLFTSDQEEGWGAVTNEAMSSGCVLIGSDAIGSVPFLVKDKKNGLIFKSPSKHSGFSKSGFTVDCISLNSLCEKVEWLLDNKDEFSKISIEARKTLKDIWSPSNAAKNLVQLISDLQCGRDTSIMDGPCSKAYPCK